jgi:tRNA pseudouridine38-40 synthase
MMRRILLTIEYKGTSYSGWQAQKNGPSVQQELVRALEKACGHKVKLVASGRTDEGVHALAQVAHFDTDCPIPDDKFPFAVNPLLPKDIRITSSGRAPEGFHARYGAKRKTYVYKLYTSKVDSPLRRELFAHIPYELDIERMREAAKYLVGEHDFSAFMASGSSVKGTVRRIYYIEIARNGDQIEIEVCGNGFLRHMVRIIAGTLIDVGRGKIEPGEVVRILKSGDRAWAGFTAPSCGLFLKGVEY